MTAGADEPVSADGHDAFDEPQELDITASGGKIGATNLALAVLLFGTSVLTAQYFGDEGRGLLALVFLWPTLVIGVANLGLPQAALFHAAKDPRNAGSWVGTAASLSALSGVAFAAIGFFVVELLLPDDKPGIVWPARLMMLGLALQPITGTLLHPWLGLRRIGRWNGLRTLVDLVPLAFIVVLIAIGSKSYTTLVTVQLTLLSAIFLLCLSFWRNQRFRFDRTKVRRIFAFGLPTALSVIPFTLSFRVDQAFLAVTESEAALGHYAVAAAWSMLCLPVLNTLANLALPRVVQTGADPSTVVNHVRFSVLVAVALAIVGGAASPFVVPFVYGESFTRSGQLAMILLPATAVLGLSTVMEELLRALHRPRSPLYAQTAGLVLTISVLWWVAPRYGVWGAAVVSACAYSLAASWSATALSRAIGQPVHRLFAVGRAEFRTLGGLVQRGRRMMRRR
ncbi:MAG: oligosaccharide flippase family protein [Ilumatobacter sp.]|nr:oligosaccharide flippase family protein [Ilumatobacter sp.]